MSRPALVTLDLDDALNICDKLNRRLGLNPGGLDRHGGGVHARRDPRAGRPHGALTRAGLRFHSLKLSGL